MSGEREEIKNLEALLASREVVITCGAGGVGKTTTAAALGVMAATHLGGKVLVLTVDPARRLANALGLQNFGNTETQVPAELFAEAGLEPRGELWVAMLDTKQSWDDLVARHAPDVPTRDAILGNSIYSNISGRFVQSHDYIAMERLYEVHSSGRYDLIIVDTPPARHAIDFLDAPARMGEFFAGRLLRWLTAPAKNRVISFASKPFYKVADSVLGSQFLEELAEFFVLFQTMAPGFVERAAAVSRVLADRRCTFVVVSTLEPSPIREGEFFVAELAKRNLHLGAVVLNRVLPSYLRRTAAVGVARRLVGNAADVAAELPDVGEAPVVETVVREVGESFLNYQLVAKREQEQRSELARSAEVVATVPYFDVDITDLGTLYSLGARLWH